jgi:hypothetical protein
MSFEPKLIFFEFSFVKARVKYHLALINPRSNNVQSCSYSTNIPTQFIFHEVENESNISSFDDYDILIKKYIDGI